MDIFSIRRSRTLLHFQFAAVVCLALGLPISETIRAQGSRREQFRARQFLRQMQSVNGRRAFCSDSYPVDSVNYMAVSFGVLVGNTLGRTGPGRYEVRSERDSLQRVRIVLGFIVKITQIMPREAVTDKGHDGLLRPFFAIRNAETQVTAFAGNMHIDDPSLIKSLKIVRAKTRQFVEQYDLRTNRFRPGSVRLYPKLMTQIRKTALDASASLSEKNI